VVMTDLPVAVLSVSSVLLCIQLFREWTKANLCLLAIALVTPGKADCKRGTKRSSMGTMRA